MTTIFTKLKYEPITFMFLKTWEFSYGNRRNVGLFLLLFFCANIIELLLPIVFGFLLNQIQIEGVNNENIWFLIGILFLLPVLKIVFWSFHGPARVIERNNALRAKQNYHKHLIQKVLYQPLSWHSERDSGDTIDKVNNASNSLFTFSQNIYNFQAIVLQAIGAVVAITFFSWYVTAFLIIFIPFAIVIMQVFDKQLIPQYKELNLLRNNISAKVFDSLSNITSVVILKINNAVLDDIKKSLKKPFALFNVHTILNEQKWFTVNIFVETIYLIPLAFYIYYNYSLGNIIEVGTVTALFLYLQKITEVFFNFAGNYEKAVQQKTDILNAKEIESIADFGNEHDLPVLDCINWKNININTLNFSYSGSKLDISVQNFSFKKGERIAILGESGSGKTTFLKLIHGLYEDVNASIDLDQKSIDTNFCDIDIHSMLVPQEPELFSSTIRENITFGMDFSDSEINEVLKITKSKKIIDNLPNKIESIVNEKGVNLSGGQKQRIALSRALLFSEGKELILLDESTSSVDPHNESFIYKSVFEYYPNKTIIASIHKMNLLKYFDTLYIFENGSLSDFGSFTDLLDRNEKFRSDWESFVESQ